MKGDLLEKFKTAQESLVVQHSDFSLSTVAEMVDNRSIDLEPHYQRRQRWKPEKQSALIESFILNVPVPPVYLSEDDYGTYSVIDGKQRITAIRDYLADEYRLRDLEKLPELNGMRYSELPKEIKNALSIRPYIRVVTLLRQSNPELKYEVFLRLNTGGETLEPQEVRNVAFSGPLNDLLYELAETAFLKAKLKITSKNSNAYRKMDDLEHVLRYFTLRDRWEDIGQFLSEEMDLYMLDHRKPTPEKLASLRDDFNRSILACQSIWGVRAFNKPQNDGWRDQLISPLFDAEMVAVSALSDAEIAELSRKSAAVLEATRNLYAEDAEFNKAVTQATNNRSNVKRRIRKMGDMLAALIT